LYSLRVRAVNARGAGAAASATARPATVPSVPLNFRVNPGNGRVVLTWAASASNGGNAITRYQVSSNNGASWINASSGTSHTFTGLRNGTLYTFRVRALNGIGASLSAAAGAIPRTTAVAPTAPRNVTATPGNRQTTLNWILPGNIGGAAITHYEVSINNGVWVRASGATSHTFRNLTNGTLYTFRVRAVNSAGGGAAASVGARPSTTALSPSAPRNVVAAAGRGQVIVSWVVPANNGGAAITRYQVSVNNGNWANASSSTSHTFRNLPSGTFITFRVRAVNSAGFGSVESVTARPT